jgi:hypothetical protein
MFDVAAEDIETPAQLERFPILTCVTCDANQGPVPEPRPEPC